MFEKNYKNTPSKDSHPYLKQHVSNDMVHLGVQEVLVSSREKSACKSVFNIKTCSDEAEEQKAQVILAMNPTPASLEMPPAAIIHI